MDRDNRADLAHICPPGEEHRLGMFLEFAPHLEWRDVPDPYLGGIAAFEFVFDLLEAAAAGLLANIRQHHL
jgi:protein-tyrosine phosphatase